MTDQAVDTGGFHGRARELKALREDIERAGLDTLSGRRSARARVLLIAGPPGSGRTALAEEFARRAAGDYPDGVLRARLTTPDGRPVPTGRTARDLLGVLGAPAAPGADEDELTEALREALGGRKALLLLDDAAEAEQVHPLIPDEPGCLVLATARGPLTGVPDVRPCTLGGLDAAAGVELLTRYTGPTRITVDPCTAHALAEECEGRPAALVLAGAWLAARPQASVADLNQRLRELPPADGHIHALRPLARAFRLVYETLPQPAARILRLLVLAPAGLLDAHTASALAGCSVTAAATTLDDFTAYGLLRPAAVPAAPDAGPLHQLPGCFAPLLRALLEAQDKPAEVLLARARMLERTVRQLQACRAAAEPADSPARKRLAGLPRALRFPSAGAAGQWLDSRLPMLLAAAALAVEDGQLDTQARRLVSALARALIIHRGEGGAAPELYPLHQLVLSVAERRGLAVEQAAALLNLADLDSGAGRTREALARYRGALDAARSAGEALLTARALESLGGAYQELGDWQRAADWYGRALSLRLSRNEPAEEARLYGRLGAVHCYVGRWGEALRDWRAAAAGYRRLRDQRGHARALGELARVQEYAGRPEESLRTCEEALGRALGAGDRRLQAALRVRMADTLDRLGDPAAARLQRAAAERLLGDQPGPAYEIRSGSPTD
ncbi:tetratricopeptide repeat protein [Streptomyces pathocidini]|uniref:Tetratricopeptide repeat protein n=1 Tax=Streptomyces pathocidini TaxID=1650571 RepID=A0ABW7UXH4_9ACTN|nr:tetratricopeptide repeat protein [Streptomyces pathocidini]